MRDPEGKKFSSTVPVESILAFLRNIEGFHPNSCVAVYSTDDEVVAVFGQGVRVANEIRPVSMDKGFTITTVQKLEPEIFKGTQEQIDARIRDRINLIIRQTHPNNRKDFRLVNVQIPVREA
jgi:hypothetical protein